ncbi:MAG: sugar ABC transporter permease, partial [Anaerolineae bacterium]
MGRLNWERVVPILLISPSVAAIAIFVYGFIGFTGFVSLTRWNKLLPDFTLVGLRNYLTLFAHPRFQIDVRNLVVFTLLFLISCLGIGLLLAVLLD